MLTQSPLNLFKMAQEKGVALGSFNVFNVEMFQAVVRAAEKKRCPIIIATGEVDIQYFPPEVAMALVDVMVRKSDLPMIMHLDHCTSVELAERCLKDGYSSIMIDGSSLPYEKNVEMTRSVVQMARWFGVPVEGELGVILGTREYFESTRNDVQKAVATDPQVAEDFVKRTGIHTLAPSVGTAHGVYVEKPKINFSILEQIARRTNIPLVIHGGSGIPPEDVRRCIQLGVAKVNVGTDLRRTLVDAVTREGTRPYGEARKIMETAREAIGQVVESWIDILESGKILDEEGDE